MIEEKDEQILADNDARAAYLRQTYGILSEADLAAMLGMKESSLANWRSDREGPDYAKLGRFCFYRAEDVKEWIDSQVVVIARK